MKKYRDKRGRFIKKRRYYWLWTRRAIAISAIYVVLFGSQITVAYNADDVKAGIWRHVETVCKFAKSVKDLVL